MSTQLAPPEVVVEQAGTVAEVVALHQVPTTLLEVVAVVDPATPVALLE